MRLTRKQKDQLRSLPYPETTIVLSAHKPPRIEKLSAQDRANIIYKMRKKLRGDLDILDDIDFIIYALPDHHLRKEIKDKDILKLFKLTLAFLRLLEFKQIRTNSNEEEIYIKHKGKKAKPTQKDINRSIKLRNFVYQLAEYHESFINIPGELRENYPIDKQPLSRPILEVNEEDIPMPEIKEEDIPLMKERMKEYQHATDEWIKEQEA